MRVVYKKQWTSLLSWLILFAILMLIEWNSYLPTLNYSRINYSPNSFKIVVSIFLIFIGLRLIIGARDMRHRILLVMFWGFFVLPNALTFAFYGTSIIHSLLLLAALMLIVLSLTLEVTSDISKNRENNYYLIVSLVGIMIFVYFLNIHGRNINFGAVLLRGIYDWRMEITGQRNFLENLIFSTSTKLIYPSLISFCLFNKKWSQALFWTCILLYLFSTSSQKSILFSLAIVLIYNVWMNTSHMQRRTILVISLLAILVFAEYVGPIFNDLIVRRVLFLPTYLNQAYFDYYDQNLYLSHSILSWIFEGYYQDSLMPPWRIGREYWGMEVSLNNGVLSDGVMNFGIVGGLLYVYIALRTVLLTQSRIPSYMLPISIIYLWQTLNSALVTTYVTHGLFAFYMVGLYFNRWRLEKL